MEKILVVGATGTTGNNVINELYNHQNYEPVAMVRKPEQQTQFEQKGIKTVLADLSEEVTNTTEGVDKVIFAAGSKGKALDAVDRKGAMKMIDAAKRHKVKKFVMLSSIGAHNPQKATELREYLQAKRDADEYLGNSGLDFTIVRPGALSNDTPTGKIRISEYLDDRSGSIPRGDVAKVLVHSLDQDVANREVFEILNGERRIENVLQTEESI
ncbi:SDR family oxidoreductase [Aquimarina brevivitae]|uniref:Uncharacterized protein YbjT (DUF2867 family) n=1 Tax=Aquimarina brevivitae TaxID=323412 RepID=A0A4Q7P275_9FLAO|nr:SDR family oxidoreductase [Aquimarina brevivitae]RZS93855.1 uncharacterized protein YbjT (DUF2867 family) [Aquimarina brevivitae]